MKIVFVCAGNVGRSPLGEIFAKHRLAGALGVPIEDLDAAGIEVTSAATRAPSGIPVSSHSVLIAAERGLDLASHRSHRLAPADVRAADLVLCMDRSNVADVLALEPAAAGVIQLLDPGGREIPDPRYEDLPFHREVAELIDRAILARLDAMVALAAQAPPE